MQKGDGNIEHIPVAKDSCLLIDVFAIHYNRKIVLLIPPYLGSFIPFFSSAKYWHEPEKFDPSRFMGEWNKDAYIPFSGGAYTTLTGTTYRF